MMPNTRNDLFDLLKSWNSLELYEHFQDEGIGIDELKMMKSHHMAEVLRNFKLGIRIRFEHHFVNWRYSMNKPLNSPHSTPIHCNCNTKISKPTMKQPSIEKITRATSTTRSDSDIEHSKLQSTVELETSEPVQSPPPIKMPRLRSYAKDKLQSAPASPPSTDPNLMLPWLEPVPLLPAQPQPQLSLQLKDCLKKPLISIQQILEHSGPKGKALLDWSATDEQLSEEQRWTLIKLIVSFFEVNELHLSLNLSHNLEQQILTMFRKEKLKYYRTEKRGKIYVKFCNMKRYKRIPKRKYDDCFALNSIEEAKNVVDVEDDDLSLPCEGWGNETPPNVEVIVKNEDFYEED